MKLKMKLLTEYEIHPGDSPWSPQVVSYRLDFLDRPLFRHPGCFLESSGFAEKMMESLEVRAAKQIFEQMTRTPKEG